MTITFLLSQNMFCGGGGGYKTAGTPDLILLFSLTFSPERNLAPFSGVGEGGKGKS